MPLQQPYYFSLTTDPVNSPFRNWTNPNFAENAPDGNYASVLAVVNSSTDALLATNWQGLPYVFSPVDLTNIVVEYYGYISPIASGASVKANANIVYNGSVYQSIQCSIALTTTPSWQTLIRISGGVFNYNGLIDNTFGISTDFYYALGPSFGSATLYIDSIRMYGTFIDEFYDVPPGYGFTRNKRIFTSTRNKQRKIIAETKIR